MNKHQTKTQKHLSEHPRQTVHKTKREVVSEIIALLFFVLLAFAFKAYTHEFNSRLFTNQAETLHLKDPAVLIQYRSITDADVRMEVDRHIKHESIFDLYLDEICNNPVGNTMLKLMIANAKAKSLPVVRIQIGPKNQFLSNINTVHINPDLYGADKYNKHIFCSVNREGMLVEKKLTICDAIFHELCHAFHTCSGKEKFTSDYLDAVYPGREEKYLWTGKKSDGKYEDDEEMYNITGCYLDSGKCFDPISCNMFDICMHSSDHESIVQRVFHTTLADVRMHTSRCVPSYKISQFLIDVSNYIVDTSK
jgi:hypothetical protein